MAKAEKPPAVATRTAFKNVGSGKSDAQSNSEIARQKQARGRFYRQYLVMRRLRDHGLAADCVSLSAGPPYSDITAQVLGRDFVVEALEDIAWLAGKDILIVKDKLSQVATVSDAPGDALILPLRVAAEIALAGEAAREQLARATALNLSCGLVRPERRRKSPARRAGQP